MFICMACQADNILDGLIYITWKCSFISINYYIPLLLPSMLAIEKSASVANMR